MRIFTLFLIYVRPGIHTGCQAKESSRAENRVLYPVRELHLKSGGHLYIFRFSLGLHFSSFPFWPLLLLLNQNKLFVCLFNRVLLFKGLQYWQSYSETLSHCPSLTLSLTSYRCLPRLHPRLKAVYWQKGHRNIKLPAWRRTYRKSEFASHRTCVIHSFCFRKQFLFPPSRIISALMVPGPVLLLPLIPLSRSLSFSPSSCLQSQSDPAVATVCLLVCTFLTGNQDPPSSSA